LQASCKVLTLYSGHVTAALCLVLLTRGPSGEPAMLTDVVWRSVSRPLVSLRRQRQPPQTAQQWGDPLAFGSRPRPLDQVPHTVAAAAGPEPSAAASGTSQSHDGAIMPAMVIPGETTSAAQPATAPASVADQGEETSAAQLVPALTLGAPVLAAELKPSNPLHVQSAAPATSSQQQLPAAEAVDWAACLREDDTDTPFTVQDFVAAHPARSGSCSRSLTISLHDEHSSVLSDCQSLLCTAAPAV
jgi:hypothetical protein